MSSQFFDLMKTKSLNNPVTQTSPPQIVEGTRPYTRSVPDLVKVMTELRHWTSALINIPLSSPKIFLDTFVPSHRNKDVRATFVLRHLVLNQLSYKFSS